MEQYNIQSKPAPLFVSVSEAARRLGVSKTLLYEEINAGRFPCQRIGGKIIVSIKLIEKMAESEETMPPRFLGKR